MDSDAHRRDIPREGFAQTGVGICREGRRYYFTQVFRQPPPTALTGSAEGRSRADE